MSRERTISHHHNTMTNAFSKINNEQIRIASKTRAVSELQESKRFLTTTIINKKMKEANSFAKRASKLKTACPSQSRKKAIINQNKIIKPTQQTSIVEKMTNNSLTSQKGPAN